MVYMLFSALVPTNTMIGVFLVQVVDKRNRPLRGLVLYCTDDHQTFMLTRRRNEKGGATVVVEGTII
jgi:hypothetical protein